MPVNIGKEDFRSKKTEKALDIAMSSLLESYNFRRITVKDICEEAMVSRATFYAHFLDKYDLLKTWLMHLKPDNINQDATYEQKEKAVNQFVHKNEKTIKNVAYGADKETSIILFNFMLSFLNITINKKNCDKPNPKYVVLANFYGGGMVSYLLWLIDNKFSPDVEPMNIYLHEIMEMFQGWQSE